MKTTIKERLIQFIKYKHIGQGKFEKTVGLSNGYICNLKSSPTADKLQMILSTFPDLNQDWLITGEGEMIVNVDETNNLPKSSNGEPVNYIPLIPVNAIGGVLTGVATNGIIRSDCEDVLAPLKSAEAAIAVQGDSMLPRFPSGSRVFIKKIDEERFIDWGNIYVLDTCNGVIIKQVSKSVEDGCIRCCSLNPDPLYQPFDVRKEDIYGIYKVLGMLIIQ